MRKVYLNHDGGVDDLVSLYLLLKMEDVELVGVGVIEADCYLEPAVEASKKIIQKFGSTKDQRIRVASSNSRPVHPFPKEWRMHAFTVDALPILNEHKPILVQDSPYKAHEDLVHVLKDQGNIEEPEHDGTAEWNVYWDPFAAKRVWESSIPIELVALESTRMVPLTLDVRDRWARERKVEGIDFLGQCYAIVPPLTHYVTNSTYFLWDVLTTASFGKEDLVKREVVPSDVITIGASSGRTIRVEDGRPVDLVYHVDRDAFFDYITGLARKD